MTRNSLLSSGWEGLDGARGLGHLKEAGTTEQTHLLL
jgi:hypothetical protein